MQIEISPEERAVLAALVQEELNDIGPEIRHTQTTEYRDELKSRKDLLVRLLDRLAAPQPAGR
jgi:hypothetical protein